LLWRSIRLPLAAHAREEMRIRRLVRRKNAKPLKLICLFLLAALAGVIVAHVLYARL